MRELLRVTLARHRKAALACGALTAVLGLAVGALMPQKWYVTAEVAVSEPMAIHRIANPFAEAPRPLEGLNELPEELSSRERLVALVKRTGLLDQWESSRPLPLRLKDQLMAKVRGPISEKDRLEALVAMLDKKFNVTVVRNHVHLSVEWTTRQAAYGLAEAALATLMQQRETRDVRALESAAHTLDEQLDGVRAELNTRASHMELELARAAVEHRRAAVDGDREQLWRDQQRAAELLVRAEEKHMSAVVMRHANGLRFIVVHPPLMPKRPDGPSPFAWLLIVALVSLLSAVTGAVALSVVGGNVMSGAQLTEALRLRVLGAVRVGYSGVTERSKPLAKAFVVLLATATGVTLGLSRGDLVVALLPIVAVMGAWQLWTRPLKWPLLGLLLAAVVCDDPTDRPYVGLWRSPTFALGKALYTNVAWLTGFEICVLGLFALMFARRLLLNRRRALDPVQGQPPKLLRLALLGSAVAVLWLIVFGVARGGVFREALWQFRALLFMPITCTVAMYSFEFPKDFGLLAKVLAIGGVVKALFGAFFIYAIATPQGDVPPHTTGHNDTMIFVTATIFALVLVWEAPKWPHITRAALLLAFVGLGMMLNDRRIAYVDIGMALGFIYLMSPWHAMKRALTRAGVMMLPVLVLYVGVGWNARGGVFKPVQKIRSIVAPAEDSEEESSNVERDIENYNITKSWEANMFLGQGFGHAFHEFTPSNDFSQSRFGHIGHNSVLWLLWIGGITGYTSVLLYITVAVYFLALALRRASDYRERIGLFVALSIILTYLNQAFGDMGMLSMQFDFFMSVAVAIGGRLAVKHRVMTGPTV